jgi:hypothetical protein
MWSDAPDGRTPTGAMPVSQASSVPSDTASTPPGIRPLKRTRPKYVSITIASVVSPTSGRANVR